MSGTTWISGALVLLAAAPAALAQDEGTNPDEANNPAVGWARSPSSSYWLLGGGGAICIFNDFVGTAKAAVPGLAGAEFSSFDRPYGSPNGNWVMSTDTDFPSGTDEVVLVNGLLGVREGTTTAAYGAGELTGFIDTKLGINDAGDWVFATNTDGATNDDYIVQVIGGVFSAAAQEGGAVSAIPGATYDDSLDSPVITDTAVGFAADGVDGGGVTTTDDDWVEVGGGILAREGITVPAGQKASEFMENFDFGDYFVTADGSHWVAQGDLTGPTSEDDVVVYDGTVVLQEDVIIPGSGFPNPIDSSGIFGVFLDHGGNWYARGDNDVSDLDWVVRNGTVVASTGAPITTGATELWGTTFFLHVGDSNGNYVIGGTTDAVSTANGVLVLNGTSVICREGDPIDVDGNGLFDDDAFFNFFGTDDGVLTDAGVLYFVSTMRNGAGTGIGDGFFAIPNLIEPVVYCTTKVNSCGTLPTIASTGTPSATDTSGFVVSLTNARGSDSFNLKQGVLLYSVIGPGNAPFLGGTLCLASAGVPIRRTITLPPIVAGTPGMCDATHMIDMNAFTQNMIAGQGVPDAALSLPLQQVWCQWIARDTMTNGALVSDALTYIQGP